MGNSASALPYKIGEETHPASRLGSYGFALHNGNRKSDNKPVTVFKGSKTTMAQTPLIKGSSTHDKSLTQIFPALHHFQKTKTLIHPNILKVYATLDTDYPNDGKEAATPANSSNTNTSSSQLHNPASLTALEKTATTGDLIIVTEPVIPLTDYLDTLQNDTTLSDTQRAYAVGYGIYNIVEALSFLHNHAKLAHGNLCPHAIYVTPSGDFKLSSLQLLTPIGTTDSVSGPTPHFRHFEKDITPNIYRSPERIESRWDAISTSSIHIMDAYSLGVLLPEIYNHIGAGTNGKLPIKLEKACQRLSSQTLSGRPRVGPLTRCPVFDTEYIKAQLFMDTLTTQDVESKIMFWKTLPDLLNNKRVLSTRVAKYKILPLLQSSINHLTTLDVGLTQDVNRRECLALLPTLFSTSTTYLSSEEFQSQLSPTIELLFRVNDRAVRGALLSRISLFEKLLDGPTLNRIVFEPMCSGFSDSSAPLRELTLKSAIMLVEHLTPANLEKLSRYLVRLQNDTEDSIRTNTVIFIGKVAPNLSDMARSKLILPAFMRAMGDPFVPCRLAGLKAISACQEYFEERKLATDVLPVIVPSLVDANEEVRKESMRVVETIMDILRQVSKKMSEEERNRAMMEHNNPSSTPNAGGVGSSSKNYNDSSSTTATSSSTSYLSGLSSWASSKMSSNVASTGTNTTQTTPPAPASAPLPTTSTVPTSSFSSTVVVPTPSSQFSSLQLHDVLDEGGNGWSNDDEDFDFDTDNNKSSSNNTKSLIASRISENDDDDFMAQFEKKDIIRPRSAVGVGGTKLNVTATRRRVELAQKKKKEPKPSVTKLTTNSSDLDDGWEDF